jgi:hypothetical protein
MSGQDEKKQSEVETLIQQEGLVKLLQSTGAISKEVALKIGSELVKLLSRGTKAFQVLHKDATDANSQNQNRYADHEDFLARVYEEQLRLETLSSEERASIIENLEDGAKRVFQKDSENKAFTQNLFKLAATGVIAALAVAVVVLSLKSSNENGKK